MSTIENMITVEQLKELSKADIRTCNKDELVDITTIKIDKSKPNVERIIDFIEAVKNPYLFKVGDVAVKLTFAENGESFQKKMENIALAKLSK
jgi:hypothetical protein